MTALAVVLAVTFTSCKKEDVGAPEITITGGATINHTLNAAFVNPTATATDDEDGDLSSSIVVTGTVNKDLAGTYTLTYKVTDAAGNEGTKDVTVIVANSQANLAGSYSVSETFDGVAIGAYTQTVTVSSTENNKIMFQKFGNYSNGLVNATVSGTTLNIPSQTVTCGSPAAARVFLGSGSISGSTITYTYSETTGGTGGNGSATLTKL